MLGVHRVFGCVLLLYGQERAGTHVKGYFIGLDAARPQLVDQLAGKVQTRRRCSDRTFDTRVYGLVARVVYLLTLAVEVRRYGDASEVFEQLPEGHVGTPFETHDMFPAAAHDDPGRKPVVAVAVTEVDADLPLFPLFQVADYAAPLCRPPDCERTLVVCRRMRFEAEYLYARTRCLVHYQTRPDHSCVVEDEHRPLRQILSHISEMALHNLSALIYKQF